MQGQGQDHGAFELPTVSEAVHAGDDDRSLLAGLSGLSLLTVLATAVSLPTDTDTLHMPVFQVNQD